MANYSDAASVHATLVANTEDIVDLTGYHGRIEIINVTGTAAIYFNVNNVAMASTPQNGTFVLPAAVGASMVIEAPKFPVAAGTARVRLRSSGTPGYAVQGMPGQLAIPE